MKSEYKEGLALGARLGLVFVALVAAGCAAYSVYPYPTPTQPDTCSKKTSLYCVWDHVRINVVESKVAEQPFGPYRSPEAGYRYVAVLVQYESLQEESGILNNVLYTYSNWVLKDSQGFSYSALWDAEQGLSSGLLYPGEKVKGWLVFEVPEGETVLSLQTTFFGPYGSLLSGTWSPLETE